MGAPLTIAAFEAALGPVGGWVVTGSIVLFAFSTILGWEYYGEKSLEYLSKSQRYNRVYRLISVSYTHLDVYKRQSGCFRQSGSHLWEQSPRCWNLQSKGFVSWHISYECKNDDSLLYNKNGRLRRLLCGAGCVGFVVVIIQEPWHADAVSYTHLDVYKRQQ